MNQFVKDFLDGWRRYRRPKRTSRFASAFRVGMERQTVYALQRKVDELHRQLNEGPTEGMAFVWRDRLQAAETGLRRIKKYKAGLQKSHRKLVRENVALKKELAALKAGDGNA